MRAAVDGTARVLCVHNVRAAPIRTVVDLDAAGLGDAEMFVNLLDGARVEAVNGRLDLDLPGYGVLWLRIEE